MKKQVFLLLVALLAIWQNAFAYSFSAVAPSGQTLYYQTSGGSASVTYPSSSSSSPYNGFTKPTGDLAIPSSVTYNGTTYTVTSIGNYAFKSCYYLTSVTIPSSVTSIGTESFYNCSNMTTITIPSSVTSIGSYAFTRLDSVNYTGTIAQWCNISFSDAHSNPIRCSNSLHVNGVPITNLIVPEGVTTIKQYAFYNCTSLTSVTIPNSVTTISQSAFYGCTGLTSATIGSSVTSINHSAFYGCTGLTSVAFNADRCISAGTSSESVFDGCCNLSNITFGNNVRRIPSYLCLNCTSLTTVSIGNSIELIGDFAFYGCSSLNVMYMKSATPPALGDMSSICNNVIDLVVPHNSYDAYINAGTNYTRHHIYCDSVFVSVNDTSRGHIIGAAPYYVYPILPPDTLLLTAIPHYGYHFTRWEDNTTDSIRQVTNNTQFVSITAYFDINQYNVSLAADSSIRGSCTGAGTYDYLSEPTIAATAENGYHFTHWSDGVIDNPRIITLTQDTSIIAHFERNSYIVMVLSNNETMGSAIGDDTVLYLDSITINANANYGYHFVRWNDNNTDNPRTVQVTCNKTYTAQFTYNQYSIALNFDTIHGTCTGGGSYNYLSNCTIQATANTGYHFTAWSDGVTDNPRVITLTKDTSIIALFERNSYVITVLSNNETMGSTIGGDTTLYLDSVIISANANQGYHFVKWNDNNTDNPRTVQVTSNKTYTAQFTYNQYNITLNVDTSIHGTCTGGGSYNYLSNRTIRANASSGYHFTTWNDGVTDNPRTIILTQDTQFVAYFAKNSYTLTFQSNNSTMGVVDTASVSGEYLDTTEWIHATPIPHYHFVRWNDNNTENPRRFVINNNRTYTAYFAIDVHTVSLQVDNLTHGSVSGANSCNYGQTVTVSATPYDGYQFSHWSDGSTYNPYTLAVVDDILLTAYFYASGTPYQDTIYLDTLILHDTTQIHDTTYINVPYAVHDTIDNYIFDTVTLTDTILLTQYDTIWLHDTIVIHDTVYLPTQDINGAEAINVKVYSSNGQIVVDGAGDKSVTLYDVNGRVLATKQDDYMPMRFDAPISGTYMIKIGDYPARKVVVIR